MMLQYINMQAHIHIHLHICIQKGVSITQQEYTEHNFLIYGWNQIVADGKNSCPTQTG